MIWASHQENCQHFVPKNFVDSKADSLIYPDTTGATNEDRDKKSPGMWLHVSLSGYVELSRLLKEARKL